ncbi:MAG: type II toxin-antitoxin system HicA family toxin [Gammaproteobacteria bacterium]|nr:type II toxin-antitoxin system HicA family toxin [Gammaproteobacteria bacterium]
MKIRDVLRILESSGFYLKRWNRSSHRQYEGVVSGRRRLVTVVGREGDDVARRTLQSIKRQSGLPARMFRHK